MVSCALGDPAKRGVPPLGVPGGETRNVSLIGGPDFDCVSVAVWSVTAHPEQAATSES